MRQPPARRRIRSTMAAAIGCGLVGGSLVGVGALGFDKVEVSAATACAEAETSPGSPGETEPAAPTQPVETPAAPAAPDSAAPTTDQMPAGAATQTPTSAPTTEVSGDLISGVVVEDPQSVDTNTPALADMPAAVRAATLDTPPAPDANSSGPLGDLTTIAPVLGPLKSELCPPPESPPAPQPLPAADSEGEDEGDGAEGDGEHDVVDTGGQDEPAEPDTPDSPPVVGIPVPSPVVVPPVTVPQSPVTGTPVVTPPQGGGTGVVTTDPTKNPPKVTRGFSTKSPPRTMTPNRTGTITRAEVITRAVSWVTQGVPYSQSKWWNDQNGVYRQDCSGYVAMVWRTDQRINYWTGNLGTISRRIASSAMKPGDILLLPRKHTVIFLGWANSSKTKFHLFEEYRTGYPARFVKNASLSYYLDRGYGSYQYNGIRDTVTVPPVEPPVVVPPVVVPPAQPPVVDQPTVPDPPAAPPADTTTAPGQTVAIDLMSAYAQPDPASAWSADALLAQLDATDWSPGIAEDYTPETDAPGEISGAMLTPEAAAATSTDQLIAAQEAVDRAEAERLSSLNTDALTLTTQRTSGAGYILAAGLGLLFLAIPLGAAARSPLWSAASAATPVAPRRFEN